MSKQQKTNQRNKVKYDLVTKAEIIKDGLFFPSDFKNLGKNIVIHIKKGMIMHLKKGTVIK
jgi:hypothetical protein